MMIERDGYQPGVPWKPPTPKTQVTWPFCGDAMHLTRALSDPSAAELASGATRRLEREDAHPSAMVAGRSLGGILRVHDPEPAAAALDEEHTSDAWLVGCWIGVRRLGHWWLSPRDIAGCPPIPST